uniref:Uncharacterized protein n=1 Tax=Oryza meridionalis TaxID=40149 RepID=A0A0E0EXF2_9ORYZ
MPPRPIAGPHPQKTLAHSASIVTSALLLVRISVAEHRHLLLAPLVPICLPPCRWATVELAAQRPSCTSHGHLHMEQVPAEAYSRD